MKVPITDIVVKERVRKEIGDLAALMESMQQHGQLNPVTITRDNELIAGHRRLLSARELGWSYVEARIVDRDSEGEKLQLELEENVHRKDFSPEELLAGYRRLEKLLRPRFTRRIAGFFSNVFGKLFRRKKPRKQPADALNRVRGTAVDAAPSDTSAPPLKRMPPETQSASEGGQYGV